jgi:hypothetical protein
VPTGCQQKAKVAEEPATVAEPKKSKPEITFESLVYDFDKVGPRKKLLGEFKFTNTGDGIVYMEDLALFVNFWTR